MGTALMLSSTKSAAVKTEVNGWYHLDASSLDILSTVIARHGCAPGVHPSMLCRSSLDLLTGRGQVAA